MVELFVRMPFRLNWYKNMEERKEIPQLYNEIY